MAQHLYKSMPRTHLPYTPLPPLTADCSSQGEVAGSVEISYAEAMKAARLSHSSRSSKSYSNSNLNVVISFVNL